MSYYLPEQSALLFQLARHLQDPDSSQNPCVLQSSSDEQEKTERRKTIIIRCNLYYYKAYIIKNRSKGSKLTVIIIPDKSSKSY